MRSRMLQVAINRHDKANTLQCNHVYAELRRTYETIFGVVTFLVRCGKVLSTF